MLSHRTNQPWNSSTWDDLRANNSHYCLSSFLLLSTQKHPSETSSSQASFWKKKYHFKNLKSIGFDFLWIIKGELTFKLSFLILLLKSRCLFVFFSNWLVNVSPLPLSSWHTAVRDLSRKVYEGLTSVQSGLLWRGKSADVPSLLAKTSPKVAYLEMVQSKTSWQTLVHLAERKIKTVLVTETSCCP